MKTIKFTLRMPEYLMVALRDDAKSKGLSINTTFINMVAKWMAKKK